MDAANPRMKATPKAETISLGYAPGDNSYPIINYEYAILKTAQPSAQIASSIKAFLTWVLHSGNAFTFLNAVHFLSLPAATVQRSVNQPAELH